MHISQTRNTNCNRSERLCGLFPSVKGEGVGSRLVHLFGMCNHTVNSSGHLDSSLSSRFPGLVLPHTTYSFMRNSPVFPKAQHPGTDARWPPGLRVAVGECVEHPRRSGGTWGAAPWGSERGHAASSSPCPQHHLSLQAVVPGQRFRWAQCAQAQSALLSLMHPG